MAGGMNRRALPWLTVLAAALPLTAATALALAQEQVQGLAQVQGLVDPTRPATATGGAVEEAPAGTQLQSVLISSRRRLAVINGATVPLGGMVGEARLVKISETEVVLKKGEETEVLKLYPGIDKQPVKRGSARHGGSK